MILKFLNRPNAVVGDFMSGSGSTAHAVWIQNKYDGGSRTFVLAQRNEKVQHGTEEEKNGFKTIPEILKQRLLNSIDDLKTDDGFQIFK